MARFEFKLPDVGEGIAEAEITAWHVKVGDVVEEDQQLADVMTDKATVEMESPVAGRVVELAGKVGDQIAIGSVLVVLETGESSAPDREDEAPLADGEVAPSAEMAQAVPSSTTSDKRRAAARRESERRTAGERRESEREEPDRREKERRASERRNAGEGQPSAGHVLASPAVRQRARDLGIDLSQVRSAGGDRIRHSDLDAFLLYNGGAAGAVGSTQPRRKDEQVKVVGLRRKIAENMQLAKRQIPHFAYVEEVDMTDLEATRAMMNGERGDNARLTLLPFVITALCRAAAKFPQINARYDDEAQVVTRHGSVHMGVATQTPNGLSVPVIRDAQDRDLWGLASEIARLAEVARSGKAAREELSGSTMTISSLGPMGGIASAPVINRPEVAIVAVNKLVERPTIVDGRVEIRKMMNLSSSFDHRVVDGWDAASFIQEVKILLERPLLLLSTR
jgi:2-oxoisovalerate dehydrogenase E2 component (dihydrolipoyl transacylase)